MAMAHPHSGSIPALAKISSYAKIAAMPAPRMAASNNSNNARKEETNPITSTPQKQRAVTRVTQVSGESLVQIDHHHHQAAIDSSPIPIQTLSLEEPPVESVHSEPNIDSGDSYEEDQSQLSGSSLNKPQSFDTKSLASVTTFAMDDKESIRPDDSASVRAADDEIPQAALSRNSSYQHESDQLSHRSLRTFPSNVIIPGRRFPTLANPPRFGNLPISPVLECQNVQLPNPTTQVVSPDDPRDAITHVTLPPDEKLLDALASAKDRLPLLQLEEKVLLFLASSTSEVLDLPPQNSFTRLLTHKLADYYSLPHAVAEDNASVRIFRSGVRVAPTPLAQLAKSVFVGSGAAPSATAVKIMRREQLGRRPFSAGNSTAPSSSVPSKTTSENGQEGRSDDGLTSPAESTPSRDKSKLTLAEREVQYKAARERIFAGFQESTETEATSAGENSADMSRSSSTSGKKKNRRNKQPKDDSFEARSAYIPSYTPVQGQYTNTYVDPSMMNGYPISPVYDQNMYGATPTQSFPGFDSNTQYTNMQGFTPMQQQFSPNEWYAMQAMQMQNVQFMYPQAMHFPQSPNMMIPGAQPVQNQMPDWYQGQGQNFVSPTYSGPTSPFFQQNGSDQINSMQAAQYGHQLNRSYSNASAYGQQNQKGNKSLFNPQTRSFVPNNGDSRAGSRGARYKNQTRHSMNSNSHTSTSTASGASTAREDSLKSRYGTPPSLPKKPPPTETKHFGDHSSAASAMQQESTSSSFDVPTTNGISKSAQ